MLVVSSTPQHMLPSRHQRLPTPGAGESNRDRGMRGEGEEVPQPRFDIRRQDARNMLGRIDNRRGWHGKVNRAPLRQTATRVQTAAGAAGEQPTPNPRQPSCSAERHTVLA
jgi:hypothetical protein